MKPRELSYIAAGNLKCCGHFIKLAVIYKIKYTLVNIQYNSNYELIITNLT